MHVNYFRLSALILIGIASGCATSQSVSSWQHNVDAYVKEKGDPAVLGDVTIDNNRHGFGAIGSPDPAKSTDAVGVLVGHKQIDNRPWFIYLVGVDKNQKVDDIRVAAVTYADKKSTWRVGKKDGKATEQYRQYNENQWKQSHPNEKPPGSYTTFPRDSDTFDLTVNGDQVTVKHAPSGATWSANLANAH